MEETEADPVAIVDDRCLIEEHSALGLAAKLAICVIASTAAFFALFGYHQPAGGAQRIRRTWCKQSADRITDVILRSTHYEMLHNDRDALYNIIQRTGQRDRASSASASSTKKGGSRFSTDAGEVKHGGG